MPGSAHAAFTMAALMAGGGLGGYAKSKSKPSLIAGIAFASLFCASGMLIQNGNDFKGHGLAAISSIALTGSMGARAMRSRKLFPAGGIALAGLASSAYQVKKVTEWM